MVLQERLDLQVLLGFRVHRVELELPVQQDLLDSKEIVDLLELRALRVLRVMLVLLVHLGLLVLRDLRVTKVFKVLLDHQGIKVQLALKDQREI